VHCAVVPEEWPVESAVYKVVYGCGAFQGRGGLPGSGTVFGGAEFVPQGVGRLERVVGEAMEGVEREGVDTIEQLAANKVDLDDEAFCAGEGSFGDEAGELIDANIGDSAAAHRASYKIEFDNDVSRTKGDEVERRVALLKNPGLVERHYEAYVFGHCAYEPDVFCGERIATVVQTQGHSEVFGSAGFVEIE